MSDSRPGLAQQPRHDGSAVVNIAAKFGRRILALRKPFIRASCSRLVTAAC